jgi:hypothetical protein
LEATRIRIDGSFQAIMSTISLIESQKAIAQAETIGKLTSLAFFFIPLSFVTGIFGIYIVGSTPPPREKCLPSRASIDACGLRTGIQ